MKSRFPHQVVAEYLDGVQSDILENVGRFLPEPDAPSVPGRQRRSDQLVEYEVNVIQDQHGRDGCPTIVETVPSFTNLFGMIEREVAPNGRAYSDHTKIRGGALLRADGESQRRYSGHGSALAQAYNHAILPLCNDRDRRTQVIWGIEDFRFRFGRHPEGLWLPEAAVDLRSLELLAQYGIRFTLLSPAQESGIPEE